MFLNHCDKYIIPALLSEPATDDSWKATVCTATTCFGLKKKWGKCSYFWHLVAKNSCHMLDSYYMIEVFNTNNRGVDYNNPYFSIERCEENKKEDEYFLSSSFWFLKGGIGNRSWCSGFEKEKKLCICFWWDHYFHINFSRK